MSASLSIVELPEAWVLTARGELDFAECPAFRASVQRIVRSRPPACVVDLAEVDYLDSSCLGLLLSLQRDYVVPGGRLVLVPSETVDGILKITRLDRVFAEAADVPAAMAILGV